MVKREVLSPISFTTKLDRILMRDILLTRR
jgi:hypothetical protein